jgi:hypothetical protein
MSIINNPQALKSVRQRNYLARDFDSFRTVLLDYARQYYPDRIQDFSDSSLGGLFLDMAAYIGDNMSFYLDHLYGELNYDTAVETANIERALLNAGVKIVGASAALVNIDFYIEVPADATGSPDVNLLPTLMAGATLRADNGTSFTLLNNVDFWKYDASGAITLGDNIEKSNGRRSASGNVVTFILKKSGQQTLCSSGNITSDTFQVGAFLPYRRLSLANTDTTDVISVTDSYGNVYYEVESLTHDVVYKNVLNTYQKDQGLVKDALKLVPAPYRFVRTMSLAGRTTSLTFGGGSASSLENNVIPDPSDFAIPLPYATTFSRTAINPTQLLQTNTLGVAAENTSVTVTYRYGGGLQHNVSAGSIRNVDTIDFNFPLNPSAVLQAQIKNSLTVNNPEVATGGEDAPTSDELLAMIPGMKHSQERVVTREDLLARVYTMPSNFGRVFRAAITNNDNNPLAIRLYIISRDADNNLVVSPNTLKKNLKTYLNTYRMVSDAIDILDAKVVNLQLYFKIVSDPSINKSTLIQSIISDLKSQMDIANFQINQPIVISDIISTIYARRGVLAVDKVEFYNLTGYNQTVQNNLSYSPIAFDIKSNTKNSILYPPEGGIFEVKYPDVDIIGEAVSNV